MRNKPTDLSKASSADYTYFERGRFSSEDCSAGTESLLPTVASGEDYRRPSIFCAGVMFEELADNVPADRDFHQEGSTIASEDISAGTRPRSMLDSIGSDFVHTVEELAREGSNAVRKFLSKR